jgi:hypothetical protein
VGALLGLPRVTKEGHGLTIWYAHVREAGATMPRVSQSVRAYF